MSYINFKTIYLGLSHCLVNAAQTS